MDAEVVHWPHGDVMLRKLTLLLVLLGFGGTALSQGLSVALAAGDHAALVEMADPIMPGTARFLARSIDEATESEARLLIVQLDTPGGMLDSTRDMVSVIMLSEIPVVVYVYPTGAHAASAGTFITAAAHVAAMAPVTNIGAASPVGMGGEDLDKTLKTKATEDAAAFLREIAEKRGRNSEALAETVMSAKAYSATEALDIGVIDLVAEDLQDLLAQLDGRSVELPAGVAVLETQGLELRKIEKTLLEGFLRFLASPDVALLLLLLGSIGIMIDVIMGFNLVFPGITGAIMLALAYVAFGELPVSWAGVALVGAGVVLLFIELLSPGLAGFGIVGVFAFVAGALLLFGDVRLPGVDPPPIEMPSFAVDWRLILGLGGGMLVFLVLVIRDIVGAGRKAGGAPTTTPSVVGQIAVVTADLAPTGRVYVGGEDWSAETDTGDTLPEGSRGRVVGTEGLVLRVEAEPERHRRLLRYLGRDKGGEPAEPESQNDDS